MPGYYDLRSSLPLEAMVYFNRYYSTVFWLVTLLLFIYKGLSCACPCVHFRI